MTFLKKLGSVLATLGALAAGIGPLVLPYLGAGKASTVVQTSVNDLTLIGQTVVQAEALIQTPGPGATKLAAAAPLVAQIIQSSEMIAGHKIANEALFIQGSTKITSGVADILNSLDAGGVKTTSGSVAPATIAAGEQAGITPGQTAS